MTTITDNDTITLLRGELEGRVIAPGDAPYDEARRVFYGNIDRRPAAIVRPAGASDVARLVTLARDSGAELAVRSGGHSLAGHGVSEGGLVLDLRDMRALEIDVAGRTAWAQTGLTAGRYTAAAGAHGLATGFGDTGSVGIGGLTLGGGIGFLARKHGLTIDDLLAAELVTADGDLVRADKESHPDLFWAIRGGGGNFGVATRFQFRLHELGTVVGGALILPATPGVIEGLVAEAEAAPEQLTAIVNVMRAPPFPFLPEAAHGRLIAMALLCWAGDVEAAEGVLRPFRALAEPYLDGVRPMPYADIYRLFGDDEAGGGPPGDNVVHSLFVDEVDERAARNVADRLEAATAPLAAAQLRVLGGAMARVPAEATAFAHRARRIMVTLTAFFPRPEDRGLHQTWADRFAAALGGGGRGAYVNFLADGGTGRVREAFPGATWDRLVDVKRRYDPGNVFRLNQNVPPSSS